MNGNAAIVRQHPLARKTEDGVVLLGSKALLHGVDGLGDGDEALELFSLDEQCHG